MQGARTSPKRSIKYLGIALSVPILATSFAHSFYAGNEWTFAPTLRLLFRISKPFTKTEISFTKARGSIRSGVITLEDLHLRREGHRRLDFDLHVSLLSVSYLQSLVEWVHFRRRRMEEIVVEEFRVDGVYGRLEMKEKEEDPLNLRFNSVSVTNAAIDLTDSRVGIPKQKILGQVEVPVKTKRVQFPRLEIEYLVGSHLRSSKMGFDLLFRSQLSGTFGGKRFSVVNGRDGPHWKGDSIPISVAKDYLSPPLGWINTGEVDIDIAPNRAIPTGPMEVALHLNVTLKNLTLLPDDEDMVPLHYQLTGVALAEYLNSNQKEIPLSFNIRLREDEIRLSEVLKDVGNELVQRAIENGKQRAIDIGMRGLERAVEFARRNKLTSGGSQ